MDPKDGTQEGDPVLTKKDEGETKSNANSRKQEEGSQGGQEEGEEKDGEGGAGQWARGKGGLERGKHIKRRRKATTTS